MDEETRALKGLKSICTYCEQISYAVRRFGSKDAFLTDFAYQATCAFSLQQIGELVKVNYSWLRSEDPHFPWSDYIRFRDFAAHNYENVDYDILWMSVSNDVAPIWNEAVRILESHDGDPVEPKNSKPRRFSLLRRRWPDRIHRTS